MDELLNMRALAKHLQVSTPTARNIATQEDFPRSVLIGKRRRWRAADVAAWMASQ